MKIFGFFISLLICSILLTGCFDKEDSEVIDDCIFPEDCAVDEPIEEDFSNKYLTAFGTEPFWDIEISGGIAKFSSPTYDTDITVPVKVWKEGENYYFSSEDLEGEFIKKDCLDGGKGDLHYYTVGVAKIRDYYYEGCGDDEEGIKLSDEDVPEDWYRSQQYNENQEIDNIIQEKIANGFDNIESCMQTLAQYPPERMPGDPQTTITVGCGSENYGDKFITGYLYTSVYPDLGIRITTPKGYDTFYIKSETPILVRDGDKISYSNDAEYIKVYEKSENEQLFDIIESSLNNNCFAQPVEYDGQNKIYGNLNNVIYQITDKDGNIWGDCIADNESLEQDYKIVRYFESSDKTKYYKMVFTDGCAPGPCSIFDDVEIF